MKRYIIVSLSKSTPDTVVFWRADNAGYTSIPFLAGLYNEETILNDLEYYTENSVPVPVEEFSNAGLKVTVNEKLIKAFRSGWKANKLSKIKTPR